MPSVYKSISGTDPVTMITGTGITQNSGSSNSTFTATCCLIVNTHSTDVTVNVYLEAANLITQIPSADGEGYLFQDINTHYFAYSLVLPAGVSIDVFQYSPHTFSQEYSLKVSLAGASDSADVSVKYESKNNTNQGRIVNQY